jgi:hypothetical protein
MKCLFNRFALGMLALSAVGVVCVGTASAANVYVARSSSYVSNPGSTVMLNPQPLPPKVFLNSSNFGSQVMLNPQPLPPKWKTVRRVSRVKK